MSATKTSCLRFNAGCIPVAAAAVLCGVATPCVRGQSITNIGVAAGGSASGVGAVSGNGQALAATVDMSLAYRWTSLGFAELGSLPGAVGASADDISTDGLAIVGTAFLAEPEETIRAYRWTSSGGMMDIGVLPGDVASIGNGISGDGSVVTGASLNSDFNATAFRWTGAVGMQSLGVIPGGTSSEGRRVSHDGGTIIGVCETPSGSRAFAWTSAGGMQNLGLLFPGDAGSSAFGVNADGSVVAGFSGANAVLWNNGVAQSLGALPGASGAVAYTISADASLVGGYSFFGQGARATIWSQSLGLVDLNVYLPTIGIDLNGWELQYCRDISLDGTTIVGEGRFNGEFRGWIVTLNACDLIDFNRDAMFPDTQDITDFLHVFAGGACPTNVCGDIDFNNDGLFPDTADIESLLSVFSGGACI